MFLSRFTGTSSSPLTSGPLDASPSILAGANAGVAHVTPATRAFDRRFDRRRTPRQSVIVVISEDDALFPERLAQRVPPFSPDVDVIVACAGELTNLGALRREGDVRFLVAPAGMSAEDLRELAMSHAPGDIVTLVSGSLQHDSRLTLPE